MTYNLIFGTICFIKQQSVLELNFRNVCFENKLLQS